MSDDQQGAWPPASRREVLAAAALVGAGGAAAMALPLPASASISAVAGERAWLETYLESFNRGDFPGFGAFYAPDVQFFGQAATLSGRDTVLDFYRMVRAHADETVELFSFVGAPARDRILAELRTTLVARRDWPDMPTGPMEAGDRRQSVNFVMYDIVDARFTRVRSARFSPPRSAHS